MFSMKKNILGILSVCLLLTGCDNVDDIPVVRAPKVVQITNGNIQRGGECAPLSPWGFPQPMVQMKGLQYVCHEGYALQFNRANGTSDWVVEHITAEKLNNKVAKRTNDLRADPALKDEVAITPNDYKKAIGWDKAQLLNYKDFLHSKKQTSQSNYMTNIVPMHPMVSNGAYDLLNQNIRQWTKDYGDVYVIAGPIYLYGKNLGYLGKTSTGALVVESNNAKLGSQTVGNLAIPTHFYKIILAPRIKQIRVFLIPNQPSTAEQLPQFASTLNTVQSITGYNFFPQIPVDFKNVLLNQMGQWPIRKGLE